jgi:hypothetical protein
MEILLSKKKKRNKKNTVWVKEWNDQLLKPHWRGPFVVILSTPTTLKVAEIAPWIHHS